MVHPRTPERRPRSSSVSSWPNQEDQMPSPAASPSSTVSPMVSPASAGHRSPRKSSRPLRTPQCAVEDDPVILARRQKQLEYGKNTLVYQQYTAAVPRGQRLGYHPRTPVKRRVQSRRRWDNAVRSWRVHLHYWNNPTKLAELRSQDSASDTSSVVSDPAGGDVAPGAEAAPAAPASVKEAAPAEVEAAAAVEEGAGGVAEAATMDACVDGAVGVKEGEKDEDYNWANDVEDLAMEMTG